jgi:hypothetical protein
MRARRALTAAVYTLLAVTLVATVVVAVRGVRNGDLKALDVWASFVPSVLTIVTIVVTLLITDRRPPLPPKEAAAALARKVARDWAEESRHCGLYRERRIAVRWRRRPGSGRVLLLAADLPDEGVLDQLTEAFARHTREGNLSRLVVTGEPGAGKTAICAVATVELAEPADSPVPVLFQLSSWNPARPLKEWMAHELTTNYPALADQTRSHRIARELVEHHVVPILDGLDEVSDPAAALRRIEHELNARSLILTCRTADFDRLDSDRILN